MVKTAPRNLRRRGFYLSAMLAPLAVACFGLITAADVSMKVIPYKGWQHNLQLSNGTVELIVTLDVGPRVIRYGFVGESNVFREYEDQLGKSGESEWVARGGHRLWHAPEDLKRTYALDNSPIKYEKLGASGARFIQPVEAITGILKEIDLTLDPTGSHVTVVHRLRNTNLWDVELAPWALSVMAPGGALIIPLPGKIPHPAAVPKGQTADPRGLLPNQEMVIWPYTDLSDARYRWGAKYVVLKQDNAKGPTKIGLALRTGWAAYLRDGLLFVKGYQYQEGRHYPDWGCNFETFTNETMLEAESLGPLQSLAAGQSVEHAEHWWLFKGIPNDTSDAGIDANIRPRIEAMK